MRTFGSLFTGIGGLDLGLERAGWTCRWQIEKDAFCRQVLARHWPEVPRYEDICAVRGADLEPVELIAGGFPCQDLSQAGKRAGIHQGARSGLWFEFARIIGELGERGAEPRAVLVENVPGLLIPILDRELGTRQPAGIGSVAGELARLGYVGCWFSLRASDFGAAHIRKRVFLVAHGSGAGRWENARSAPRDETADGRQQPECESAGVAHDTSGGREQSSRRETGAAVEPEPAEIRADLADGAERRRGELREPPRQERFTDGRNGLVADSGCAGADRRGPHALGDVGDGDSSGPHPSGRAERTGDDLADARCPSGGAEFSAGEPSEYRRPGLGRTGANMADTARHEQSGLPGKDRPAGAVVPCTDSFCYVPDRCSPGECWLRTEGFTFGVSDTRGAGWPDAECAEFPGAERETEGRAVAELCSAPLPEFAPGPTDARWPAILRERPDLAPALESPVRGVADGLPDWVHRTMSARTKRLSRLGNAVVPQVAEWIGRRLLDL